MSKSEMELLPNIGKVLAERLLTIGINNHEQLDKQTTKDIFLKIISEYPDACINMLYAIEGAKRRIRKTDLDKNIKTELTAFFNSLRK